MTDRSIYNTLTSHRPQQDIRDEWAEMKRPLPLWADPDQHRTAPLPFADAGMASRFAQRLGRYFYDDPMRLRSAALSVADPFDIPSAALGLMSPSARDHWRQAKSADPVASMTGGILGTPMAIAALPKIAGTAKAMAAGGALGASPDAIDSVADRTNYMSLDPRVTDSTTQKALFGTMLFPARSRIPF